MTHLCELSQKALSGHLAAKSLRDDKTKKFTNVDVTKRQQIVREDQEAERVICKYVDFLMSTENTCNPDSGNWVKPDIHPCRKNFDDIQQIEWDKDYENLLNSVQRHTQCSTAYCLRRKGQTDNYSCRFDYPKQYCDDTHIEYEEVRSKDGSLHFKVKVVTKRNDTRLNNHQRLQLQGWRANCDIQIIVDYYSCLEYI